jgi:trigger factor
MQVSVETTSELSRKMTVLISEEKIQEKVSSRLRSLANEIKLDGFRPGKIPQSVVKKRFGQKVREEVLSELLESSFNQALLDEKLKPAGLPQITPRRGGNEGEGLEYEVDFEVLPEFVPMPFETLEVKRYHSEISEHDIDMMIQRLRDQRESWHSVDRPAIMGDRLVTSFEGKIDSISFTEGRVENFPVVLGGVQKIPGFEEHLMGATAGSHHEFDTLFPSDYPNEKLAGKWVRFLVDVAKVEIKELPEVNAAFIQSLGVEDGELSSFRENIKTNMEREMRQALRAKTKTSAMDAIYERNPISLPNVLIEDELKQLLSPYQEAAKKAQQSLDEAKLKEQFEPLARKRVALALILGRIAELNHLTTPADRVRAAVEDLAMSYEDPDAVIRWYYEDRTRLREVENLVMEDQIVDLVLQKANATEIQLGIQELMQPNMSSAPWSASL